MNAKRVVVIIQQIVTHWTKHARPAEGAALRNAVPDALRLPMMPELKDDPVLLHHTAVYSEADHFTMPKQEIAAHKISARSTKHFACVRVRWDEGKVHVIYAYDRLHGGAPKRTSYPRQVFSVHPGEWGRVAYNGRHVALSGMSGWFYRQDVLNIAVLETLKTNPFMDAPKREFSDLAHLR